MSFVLTSGILMTVMTSEVVLKVITEYHSDDGIFVGCCSAEFHYAECNSTWCRSAGCH